MPIKIPVAHDFICPWCWIALAQAAQLESEFDVEFEWLSYELYPEGMEWPKPNQKTEKLDRPKGPSRIDLAYAAQGMPAPIALRPFHMRSHNAHEAVEYAETVGAGPDMRKKLYKALYLEGREINDPSVIAELAEGVVPNVSALLEAVKEKRFQDKIVAFDDDAAATGVFGVPTIWIGSERFLEQPIAILRPAVAAVAEPKLSFYADLRLPPPPEDRPYVLMNMVATVDGKTADGNEQESVLELGSKADHQAMHRIERQVDAVMIGAATLRASPTTWRPRTGGRVVVSRTGDLPWNSAFLNQDAEKAFILRPTDATFAAPQGFIAIETGTGTVDLVAALGLLRKHHDVTTLLVEGGSELNAQLISAGLVDEVFLTVAPKMKLGRQTKTYAGGDPLPREAIPLFELVEHRAVGDEVFLRYRRR
jgi:riboflavin-specific deaminase-like protein